jgi:AcrR family transcriptional regulator
MARPVSISRQQILEAAREVFLERGFANASTVEIARRARVSEGSIFNRFTTKEGLFEAAMDESLPPALTLSRYVNQGDIRTNLVRITVESIEFLSQLLPKLMLRWSERDLAQGGAVRHRPREILSGLTDFFASQIALGRLRGDPHIAARIFMGAVWNYCFLQTVAGDRSMSPPTFARGLVAELWRGLAPASKRRRGAR